MFRYCVAFAIGGVRDGGLGVDRGAGHRARGDGRGADTADAERQQESTPLEIGTGGGGRYGRGWVGTIATLRFPHGCLRKRRLVTWLGAMTNLWQTSHVRSP